MSRFLVTYVIDNNEKFKWFHDESSMQSFLDNTDLDFVIEAIEVLGYRDAEIGTGFIIE